MSKTLHHQLHEKNLIFVLSFLVGLPNTTEIIIIIEFLVAESFRKKTKLRTALNPRLLVEY